MSQMPPPLPPSRVPATVPPSLPASGIAPMPPPAAWPNQVVTYSKAKVIKSIFGFAALALVVLICGGFINPRWVGWCLIAVGILILVVMVAEFRKLFSNSPVLVLSEEGLRDNSAKPSVLVPWADIRKVTLWTWRVNGVPGTRTLILELNARIEGEEKHKIDLDNLKGNPHHLANTVLAWANRGRLATPIMLQEGAGEKAKS